MAEKLPFTMAFAYEIALGFDPPEEVCARHKVPLDHFERLQTYEPFTAATSRLYQDILKDGVTLETKAKIALEALLPCAAMLAKDEAVDAATRVKALEFLARVARIDGKSSVTAPGPGFQFVVVMGDSAQSMGVPAQAQAIPHQVDITPPPSLDDVFELPAGAWDDS